MKTRYKKIIYFLIGILTISLIFIGISKTRDFASKEAKLERESKSEDLPLSKNMPEEYRELLDKIYQDSISVSSVRSSKVKFRNPLAVLNFTNKFRLLIFKINLLDTSSLEKIFIQQNSKFTDWISEAKFYKSLEVPEFELMYKSGIVYPANKIYFSFDAKNIFFTMKSDSIYAFTVKTYNVAIRYSLDDFADVIILGPKTGNSNIFNFLFYQKAKNLYLLMLQPTSSNIKVPDDLLFKIIGKGSLYSKN